MKSQKGITLITLVISVIVLIILTGMLISMSDFFFANTKHLQDASKNIAEYNKFNMYFIEDVKNNTDVQSISDTEIIFEDGTVYTYALEPDNGIYRNKVKICDNIGFCRFSKTENTENEHIKKIISVRILIKGAQIFDTKSDYVLKYW